MFLPVGDLPNPKTTPYTNWLLIGINIAVFLAFTLPLSMTRPDLNDPALLEYLRNIGARGTWTPQLVYQHVTAYDLFVFQHAFRPAEFSIVNMFTAMFLHAGWLHLAGNMLFLWIYGDNVEDRLGHIGYLVAYLISGLFATLFFSLFVPHSQVPMLGASGAISGVLGFYFLWFPHNRIKVFIFLFPFIMTTVLIPARIVLGMYLIIDNLLPFLVTSAEGGGVAHGAHIGGFIAGLAIALAIDRLPKLVGSGGVTLRQGRKRAEAKDAVAGIHHALATGEAGQAAGLFLTLESAQERRRLSTRDLITIGEHFLASGAADEALTLFRRLIAERPGDPGLDRAYLDAGRALLLDQGSATAAWHYFLAAVDLARTPETAAEARRYLREIEGRGAGG